MQNFSAKLEAALSGVALSEDFKAGDPIEQMFYAIVDDPTDMTNYMAACDYFEEEGMADLAGIIRLVIRYPDASGPQKTKLTKQIAALSSKSDILDKVSALSYSKTAKNQVYMLMMNNNGGDEAASAHTYDARRDRRHRPDGAPHPRFRDHPSPDQPFITAKKKGFDTGESLHTFSPGVIAAMILHILLANNPAIKEAIQKSKSLSRMSPFRTIHMQDPYRDSY